MENLDSNIVLRITRKMKLKLQEIADEEMISISHLVRRLLLNYLKDRRE